MSAISDYKARVSSSMRTSLINDSKARISQSFKDSPSYQEVYINSSSTLTGVRIVDDSQSKEQKLVVAQNEVSYSSGDYLTWNNEKWLTSIVDDMGGIYKRGIVTRCTSSIKWLTTDGFQREAYFSLLNNNLSSIGIQQGQIIDLGNERRQIVIQSNEDTKGINKDKRFIFDGRAWKVVNVDRLSQGVIYLGLEEDQFDPTNDNIELRIADYYNNLANYTISILNGDSLTIEVGQSVQLNAEIKNNGSVVTMPVQWSVDDTSVAAIDSNGLLTSSGEGEMVVTVSLVDDPSVTDVISVSIQSIPNDVYTMSITSTSTTPDEIKNNQSKTYTISVLLSGTPVDESVSWEMFADDMTNSTNLASITSQSGTSCTVKNNAANSGYVQLRAVLDRDNSVVAWKRVQMKPLF